MSAKAVSPMKSDQQELFVRGAQETTWTAGDAYRDPRQRRDAEPCTQHCLLRLGGSYSSAASSPSARTRPPRRDAADTGHACHGREPRLAASLRRASWRRRGCFSRPRNAGLSRAHNSIREWANTDNRRGYGGCGDPVLRYLATVVWVGVSNGERDVETGWGPTLLVHVGASTEE